MTLQIANRTAIPSEELLRLGQPLASVAPVDVVEQRLGPMNMWEAILPSAVALLVAAPIVSGFLQKLGEDAATGLVAGLHALFRRAGAEDLTVYRVDRQEPTLDAEPRLVAAATSPPFSVEMEIAGHRLRFLYPQTLDEMTFFKAAGSMRERALWVESVAAAFALDQQLKHADPKRLLGVDDPQHVAMRLMHQDVAFRSLVSGSYVYVPEQNWWVHVA